MSTITKFDLFTILNWERGPYDHFIRRQMHLGLLHLLKEATELRGVQIRILIPADEHIKDTINQAAKVCPKVIFRVAQDLHLHMPRYLRVSGNKMSYMNN